jgi:hypothetical protein
MYAHHRIELTLDQQQRNPMQLPLVLVVATTLVKLLSQLSSIHQVFFVPAFFGPVFLDLAFLDRTLVPTTRWCAKSIGRNSVNIIPTHSVTAKNWTLNT